MYNVREVTEDLYWVAGNDRKITRFENIHPVPHGTYLKKSNWIWVLNSLV